MPENIEGQILNIFRQDVITPRQPGTRPDATI
jgi:hypothetical protein